MENIKDAEARKNKATNPYVVAGFFKKLFFTWMFPLFYKGYKDGLEETDIYSHLKAHDSQILGDKLEREWNKEVSKNNKNPSLWKAFAKVFGKKMMFYGLGILIFEIIRLTLPLTLAQLLEYFEPNTTMTRNQAYLYAGILSSITVIQMLVIHHTMFHLFHMGMRLRVAAVALVYRKAIRLSKSALADTTIGQMVNLISNDVSRFETCTYNAHDLWIGPIQSILLLFLLYWYAGWTSWTGVAILLCVVPFQMWMGKKTSVYRLRTALKTDERIRIMNEIISGIQVIKMYTWEKPFTKIVEIVRRLEMREIEKNLIIKAIHVSFNFFLTRTLIYSCVVVYVLTGNTVNAKYVFGISLFYELLRQCMSDAFFMGITQAAEAITSMRRIKNFLLYDELEPGFNLTSLATINNLKSNSTDSILVTESITDNSRTNGIYLENVSARWIKTKDDNLLDGINFDVSSGELATIIGKVGSGKSTLLHVILRELPPVTGTVKVYGTISYASQEPWLFVGSVRQNILFGQDFDVIKYHEVIRVCALERDFKLLPHGDYTIIGERGVSLSGGQKARINLARAVYKEADIYLLDDPLSAVDAKVGNQIFKECISGYMKEKCVVLVTHQLQYLKDCKKIYLLDDGRVELSGTYDDIKNAGKQFTKLLEELKTMEENAKKEAEEVRKRKRTMSAEGGNQENNEKEGPTFAKEGKMYGKVTWDMYKSYLLAGGNACKIIFLAVVFVLSQALASSVDYFLSVWVNLEQMKLQQNITGTFNNTLIDSLDNSEYSVFQKFWFGILTENICLIVYTGLILMVAPLVIGRAIFFFKYCITASINLHNDMFSKIVYAPMRFFNQNPSGRILNRFSKDMNLVDEFLPVTFSDTVHIGLMMLAIIVVVATVIPLILIPSGVILIIFYVIRVVFIATSRDIKRFEAITRSPVYSHLTASLQGLTTIRSFGAQHIVKEEFDNYQDSYSASYFMFLAANRTFGFWLDLNTSIFLAIVTFSFLIIKTDWFGGSVGLAITQSINLAGWFQYGIRQWSQMETTMTSVERIKEYAEVVPESDSQAKEPPKDWPESGNIKFNNVCLRYASEEPYVLRNLKFTIKSTEKVGIVGRTGAGKSSVIAALFRLAEIDGQILIDNIDSKTIPLSQLRSSISIIPQEPVLFSGTLRKNLDPFDEYSDQVLWNAIEEVELKPAVSDLPHGLESRISEGGSNFSVGQRQLVCLARAIVRRNKILVLDEATASVDPHTDGLIQNTIRRKFASCTVLTIAHRLHTIMDSDKVLVMDAGRAVEFDHPYVLLQDKRGVFFSLVQQTGKSMASNLLDIAAKNVEDAKARKNRVINPYAVAGFFKKLFFAWMFSLFYKGYKYGLTEDNIYPHLKSHDSEILGDKLEREWNKEVARNKSNPSLWTAFAKVFGKEMMFYGLGIFLFEVIRLTLPLTLAKLLEYFEPNTTMTSNEAYIYAAILSCITLAQIIALHQTYFHLAHMGMRMRVAAVALVYRKAIRLSKSALAETTIGQMVNLISNDVSRFETCTYNAHDLWIGPLQLFLLLYLLYWYAGWTGWTGVGILLCIVPFQIWMGKKISVYRLKIALKTDERIRLMNEIISGIQVIKMYTWEKPFTKIVDMVRRLEMKEIQKTSILKAIHISLNIILTRTLIYSCILVYVLIGNTISAKYVFGISLFYELLRQRLSDAFAYGVMQAGEAIISMRRIKQFLLYDELEPQINLTSLTAGNDSLSITDSLKPIGISLENNSTRWIKSNDDYSLEGINFDLSSGELAIIIGKVGSGKSTLLHAILRELPPVTGTVKVHGTISYAPQEPWLFVGSVRQNILFGQEFDVVKYREVVRACALERDFQLFPHGDHTIIGERGVSLSGGQKARINLARAVYKEADIYLLDDPLSAVDAHVGKEIFKHCISGYLKGKCVVLVTHQLQYLKDCKKIYLLDDGKVEYSGTYNGIKKEGNQFTKLSQHLKQMEEEASREVEQARTRKITISEERDNQENNTLEAPAFAKEEKVKGKVTWNMYKSYFLAGGKCYEVIFVAFIFVLAQTLASSVDYFLSIWVNLEEMKLQQNLTGTVNDTLIGSLDGSQYSESENSWFGVLTEKVCLLIYTGLIVAVIPLIIGKTMYFFKYCITASIHLHNDMFSKIVYAPMRFFNLNPSGRILNRFSKDMNLVDEYLPETLSDTINIGIMMLAIIVVVVTVIPLILIPTGIILIIFYVISVVFIATSRDLKRFEAIARSPVYSHLTVTLQGLTTIRAFGAQNIVRKEFDNFQDSYSASYFMFFAADRTFGFWMDLHTSIFVALVTFGFLIFKSDSFGGSVGLAITQSINLAVRFQYGIRQWNQMENTMTSVERIKEYAEIVPESDSQPKEPHKDWPEKGNIEFENVCLRYVKDEPYVLKNIKFSIKSTEKIGIVGRTGAGKSSIITALFRLAEIDGQILVDNIDNKTIPLNRLRSSISIIPQEPVLFSGTLRTNLDPFDEYSDAMLWNAIEEVELKATISDLPHGLGSKMSEGGNNFSVGQRQLICLARAIARENKILVLDEATANVDPHTDELIQRTIRRKFASCTVLTIAHRLHTIMDSDKVLVMDAGKVVEFDHPYALLRKKHGIFVALVQQTGGAMTSDLLEIADKAYKSQIS